MKVFLLHRNQDFNPKAERPWNEFSLATDLELGTIFNAMAGEDKYMDRVVQNVFFTGFNNSTETIFYRQEILKDCLINPSVVREIYQLTVDTAEEERKHWWLDLSKTPTGVLVESIDILDMLTNMLRKLRQISEVNEGKFNSEGFKRFFSMIQAEVGENYLQEVSKDIDELRFRRGLLFSADLKVEEIDPNYILRQPPGRKSWWREWLQERSSTAYTYHLDPRDEAGATILGNLKDRGLNRVANALGQASEHVRNFLHVLREELAFYVGCLNLHEKLSAKGATVCFPAAMPATDRYHEFKELRDTSLVLTMNQQVVGNIVNANNKNLIIITGANQGGKSSFLRSIGVAQIMM